jgi:hypothetical protein
MTRKTRNSKAQAQAEFAQALAEHVAETQDSVLIVTPEQGAEQALDQGKLGPKTIVKVGYKRAYQDRAAARGLKDKVSKRGNGDWLQRELQSETVHEGRFDLARFERILEANGVDHSRWNRTTRGWEGRVRMSGSISLRGVVGKSGMLRLPAGEETINVQALADDGDVEAIAFLAKWSN